MLSWWKGIGRHEVEKQINNGVSFGCMWLWPSDTASNKRDTERENQKSARPWICTPEWIRDARRWLGKKETSNSESVIHFQINEAKRASDASRSAAPAFIYSRSASTCGADTRRHTVTQHTTQRLNSTDTRFHFLPNFLPNSPAMARVMGLDKVSGQRAAKSTSPKCVLRKIQWVRV